MNNIQKTENKHVRNSIFIASAFSIAIIFLFVLQQFFPERFCPGIKPGSWHEWYGVFLYPFFHGDIGHLMSNLPPLFLLVAGMFYYFPKLFFKSLFSIWFGSAIIIWIFGRPGCHLGASGLIYGYAFLLAALGFIKKQRNLGAFALILVFLYGGIIWGVLPNQAPGVSWEGHAGGAFIGILLAIIWSREKTFNEILEPREDANDPSNATEDVEIIYHFKESVITRDQDFPVSDNTD